MPGFTSTHKSYHGEYRTIVTEASHDLDRAGLLRDARILVAKHHPSHAVNTQSWFRLVVRQYRALERAMVNSTHA